MQEPQCSTTIPEMEQQRLMHQSILRVRNAAASVVLFAKLLASFVLAAYDGWIRKQLAVVSRLRDKSFTPSSLLLFLTALSGYISYPTSKVDPLLQSIRLPRLPLAIGWFPRKQTELSPPQEPEPEKSVHIEVLYDPAPDPVRADVIFIHGLHGSIVHTWKQGLWHYRKEVQNESLTHQVPPPVLDEEQYENKSDSGFGEECSVCDDDVVVAEGGSDCDHDVVLENITDIINSIDDKVNSRASFSEEPYSLCWPRDWLPKDCPGVRVIALNYTTDPFLWRPVWITKRIRTSLQERSKEMADSLMNIGIGQHPIVWVGHSKGGLFVKQMLVDARESEDIRLRKFLLQTQGIMFYSVPHRGSTLAHLNLPLLRQSIELTEVKKGCQEVLALHKEFMKLYEEKILTAEIFSFVETILTFMFVTNVRVVSVDSADLGFGAFQGVNIDHREICKPLNRNCFLYKELADLINRVV